MEDDAGLMKTWAWTSLNEATGMQFGRFRTEKEAGDDAKRRTTSTRNLHRAAKAEIRDGERVIAEVRCERCSERFPDVDEVVLLDAETKLVCDRCSVGERKVNIHPLVRSGR